MKNDTTGLCIEGFIDWVAAGAVADLFCVPSLILILLDFPPLCQTSAALVQKLGIMVMILGQLFPGVIHALLLHLFLGLLDVPCNAGGVPKRGNAELYGHVGHCITTLSVPSVRMGGDD